jgi:hypothetical protein
VLRLRPAGSMIYCGSVRKTGTQKPKDRKGAAQLRNDARQSIDAHC